MNLISISQYCNRNLYLKTISNELLYKGTPDLVLWQVYINSFICIYFQANLFSGL